MVFVESSETELSVAGTVAEYRDGASMLKFDDAATDVLSRAQEDLRGGHLLIRKEHQLDAAEINLPTAPESTIRRHHCGAFDNSGVHNASMCTMQTIASAIPGRRDVLSQGGRSWKIPMAVSFDERPLNQGVYAAATRHVALQAECARIAKLDEAGRTITLEVGAVSHGEQLAIDAEAELRIVTACAVETEASLNKKETKEKRHTVLEPKDMKARLFRLSGTHAAP